MENISMWFMMELWISRRSNHQKYYKEMYKIRAKIKKGKWEE